VLVGRQEVGVVQWVHQSHDAGNDRNLVGCSGPGLIAWARVWVHGDILSNAAKARLGSGVGGVSRRMSEIACHGREEYEVVDGSRRH
jgi:hypothetical protein